MLRSAVSLDQCRLPGMKRIVATKGARERPSIADTTKRETHHFC